MKKLISLLMLLTVASSTYMPTMHAGTEVFARQTARQKKQTKLNKIAPVILTGSSCNLFGFSSHHDS